MRSFLSTLKSKLKGWAGITVDADKNVTAEGDIAITKTTANPYFIANANAGQTRGLRIHTAGVLRWIVAGSNVAEGGANAGTTCDFYRYADDGSFLGTAVSISRSTGGVTLEDGIDIGGVVNLNGNTLTDYRTPPTEIDDGDSPYTFFSDDAILNCDTDAGAITANLPPGIIGEHHNPFNIGTSGNDVAVTPDGAELLFGVNEPFILHDGEGIVIAYSDTKGWW